MGAGHFNQLDASDQVHLMIDRFLEVGAGDDDVSRLTELQVEAARDLLLAAASTAWRSPGLPAELTPDNTEDVQRIITAVSDHVDRPIRAIKDEDAAQGR